jgi:membrane-bound serine protease (ClpP class)
LFGLVIAVVLALLFAKFIPSGWFFSRLAVSEAIMGSAQFAGVAPELGARAGELLGARGVAVTALYPSGQIEVAGRRYEARVEVGSVGAGAAVMVTKVTDFGLVVEVVS